MPKFEKKITIEQRQEIIRRALAGENMAGLGREFGVTRAYVSLLRQQALDPEGFERKKRAQLDRILTKRLSLEERARFIRTLATSKPADHFSGAAEANKTRRWTLDTAKDLAYRMFSKRPGRRFIQACLDEVLPKAS